MTDDCRDVFKDISEKPERATHPPSVEIVLRIILSKEYHFFFCDHNYQMRVSPYEDQQESKHDFNA